MARRLIYVMDPLCSWCWALTPALKDLLDQAMPAAADFSLHVVGGGRRSQKTEGSSGNKSLVGYEGDQYDNESSCRALVVARSLNPDLSWAFAQQMQQAFHCKGVDISKPEALTKIAERVGLDPSLFAEKLNTEEMREATLADFHWIESLGVNGFPALLAEQSGQLSLICNGYQTPEDLAHLLKRWLQV